MQVSYSAPLHIVEARKIVPVYCLTKLCRLEGRKRWEMSTLHVGILEGKSVARRARARRATLFLLGWGGELTSRGFLKAGSRGAAPGGVSGVPPDSLPPLAPEGGRTKKPLLERSR